MLSRHRSNLALRVVPLEVRRGCSSKTSAPAVMPEEAGTAVQVESRPLGISMPLSPRGIVPQAPTDHSLLPKWAPKGTQRVVVTSTSKEMGSLELASMHKIYEPSLRPKSRTDLGTHLEDLDLHSAVILGDYDKVKQLLQEGSDIEAVGDGNWRPLHYAIDYDRLRIFRLLLEKGADASAKTANNCTTLHRAALNGNGAMVTELLESKQCDPNDRTHNQWTPMHYAAWGAPTSEAIRRLHRAGGDIEAQTDLSFRPIHFAAMRAKEWNVGALLDLRVELNIGTVKNAMTPLHCAAQGGSRWAALKMMQAGANPNASTGRGMRPIHYAALHAHFEILAPLVMFTTEVDPADDGGFRPLHLAAKKGSLNFIKLLRASGDVDINSVTKEGIRAVDYAYMRGHTETVEWFMQQGAVVDPATLEKEDGRQKHASRGGEKVPTPK